MKKMFVKLTALVMTLAMGLSLVGCGSNIKQVKSQILALTEVNSQKSDMAVIDSTMAGYMLTQDAYSNLSIVTLDDAPKSSEEYGVAAKKTNLQLIDTVNRLLVDAYNDGTMKKVAEDYGLSSRLMDTMEYTAIDYGTDTSYDKILEKGSINIAYTINPPMGVDGETITGFDIDLAKAIFPNLKIETTFIDWGNKELELDTDKVDLVWNGLTITDDRKVSMAISVPYMINEQSFVVHKDNASKYTTISDLANIKIAVETESAGEYYINEILASL